MKQLPKGSRKLIHAWAFYDWANSVYSLVISSAIFPIFYGALTIVKDSEGNMISDTVSFLGFSWNNDTLISYVTAAAFLVVSFLSPFLSGIADYVGNKKNFLKFFCYLGAVSCIGLFWFNLENLWFGLLFYFLALIGFWSSLVFYNSYLPDIATKEKIPIILISSTKIKINDNRSLILHYSPNNIYYIIKTGSMGQLGATGPSGYGKKFKS